MAQILFGKGYMVSAADAVLAAGASGTLPGSYVTPLIPAPEVVDQEDEIKQLKNVLGVVEGIICPNDCILKCTFNFVPRASTKALALVSASIPVIGAYLISGLPVVQVRQFADAFNTAGTNPWFYFGGASLTGGEDGKEWRGTITLMRFIGITSGTAIS